MSQAVYTAHQVLPRVYHIHDALGVHLTLLVGSKRALLFDTGYGAYDLPAFIKSLTDLPLSVVLSHGHHDHALGAVRFQEVFMRPEDLDVLHTYTDAFQRQRVLERARLSEEEAQAYLSAPLPKINDMPAAAFDLGGLTAVPLPAPGHTPGSLAMLVPERELLLLGDSWNPQTWVFFPEALLVHEYVNTFHKLMEQPFSHALAPHKEEMVTRGFLETFQKGLTEKGFANAKPFPIAGQEHIPTLAFEPTPGSLLVFRQP